MKIKRVRIYLSIFQPASNSILFAFTLFIYLRYSISLLVSNRSLDCAMTKDTFDAIVIHFTSATAAPIDNTRAICLRSSSQSDSMRLILMSRRQS